MIKLIIFDWDDVLTLGATAAYFKCYHETLLELGVKLQKEEEERRILMNWGKSYKLELDGLLREHRYMMEKAYAVYDTKLFGTTFIDCLRVVPGSPAKLSQWAKKYKLCIATGIHPKLLKERIIPRFKFPDVFAQVISTYDIEEVKNQKPSPYMIKHILETQKVKPEQAIFVGDAKSDVAMALGAKVTPVVVLTGHLTREEGEKLGVKHIINDVTELDTVLKKL
jgi:phosphoglycolate phosphatase-like HAD superfamily hydrolase